MGACTLQAGVEDATAAMNAGDGLALGSARLEWACGTEPAGAGRLERAG
jgi:hypothetical protein